MGTVERYTWWSYHSGDRVAANTDGRLDHFWATAGLDARLKSIEILREARGWERRSDHVPVMAVFG